MNGSAVSEMRFSTRNNKVMNYNEDEMDDDLELSEEDYYEVKSQNTAPLDNYEVEGIPTSSMYLFLANWL